MAHHTKDKGDLAAAMAIADLTLKGYACFTPVVSEHLPFDIIAYKDGISYRIQAKYAQKGAIHNTCVWNDKHGCHVKKYGMNDFDYYAIYLPDIQKIIYPSIQYGGKTISTTLPNSAKPFLWWEDFINFTDNAVHKTFRDFNYSIIATITPAVIAGRLLRRRVERPTKEELETMLWEQPTIQIAKLFNVSDQAVAKWAKAYGISKPPRGYWAKKLAK
jgi:hypothetical protein